MTDQAKQDQPFFKRCKCNGCPLPVVKVSKWWPKEKKRDEPKPRAGVCEYHAIVPAHDWMQAVGRINQHRDSIRAVYAVRAMTDDNCKPRPGEGVEQWLFRVEQYLRDQITGFQPAHLSGREFAMLKQQLTGQGS